MVMGNCCWPARYLLVVTEQGDVVLVRATPESHQELARFPAIEGPVPGMFPLLTMVCCWSAMPARWLVSGQDVRRGNSAH